MSRFQDSFLANYTAAQPALQRFVAAHIPDLHEVQDVMQEVAVTLWKHFDEYTPGTSFQKWSIQVTKYKVLHARRAHARRRLVLTSRLEERAEEYYGSLEFETIEERRRALDHCLHQLPEAQSGILAMRYKKGLSCAQIAREKAGTEEQVRVQLFRLRAALRSCVNGFLGLGEGTSA